jgi:tetratricopeptide (TPR) repeat protein|tara:strand:- start:769 stop:1143 length:375 start_codon:yes stop_codon:yes gene_type:complete
MALKDEKKILEKKISNYKDLTAAQLTSEIVNRLKPQVLNKFMESNRQRMPYCLEAEKNLENGRSEEAIKLLDYALSKAHYGNEYLFGLLGDAYMKKDDIKKAFEYYEKSGSHDSLKKGEKIRRG